MRSQLCFFLVSCILAGQSVAFARSEPVPHITLQVASFPDKAQAERFAIGLVKAGEKPAFDTVEIPGRGFWTRVFVGLFTSDDAARRQGVFLIARGVISQFLIRRTDSIQALTRPRRVVTREFQSVTGTANSGLAAKSRAAAGHTVFSSPVNDRLTASLRSDTQPVNHGSAITRRLLRDTVRPPLPNAELAAFLLTPGTNTDLIPRPDPVSLAFKVVTGEVRRSSGTPAQRGGLWITGDTTEALARLHWIAGKENAGLIGLDPDGRVRFDTKLLAKTAGIVESRAQTPLRVVDYISSNEGLLLLVQLAYGRFRYLFHIGRQAPTYGKLVETTGSINLDNNVDSRINPYRKNGKKLDGERPPEGFDSLIALNPVARWFNLSTNGWVQAGEIVFHEFAEAHAKLELGLDYLDQESRPGAHTMALVREQRLKSQRPGAGIVITTGSNRLLRTEEEIRVFTAEASASANLR
jgi:hypothetical protein